MDQIRYIRVLHIVVHDARFKPGQIEHVPDHLSQALSALQVQVEQAPLLLGKCSGNALEQQVGRFLHGSQWRFELMRDVRDEILLHLIDFDDPRQHVPVLLIEPENSRGQISEGANSRQQQHVHQSSILYDFNLLRIVFTSSPSWRAASALLWLVFSSVRRMSSRSASAAVIPRGRTIFVEDSVPGFRRYGGGGKVSVPSPRGRKEGPSLSFFNTRKRPGPGEGSMTCGAWAR